MGSKEPWLAALNQRVDNLNNALRNDAARLDAALVRLTSGTQAQPTPQSPTPAAPMNSHLELLSDRLSTTEDIGMWLNRIATALEVAV